MADTYLSPKEIEVIEAFIACDMNANKAAEKIYYSRSTILYYLEKIKMSTGFDPHKVRDLWELDRMVKNQHLREAHYDL